MAPKNNNWANYNRPNNYGHNQRNQRDQDTVEIKAPYNFVPLEEKAFYPSWANHISQDIPFEDGVSGSIEYTITAKTPIFVRNGQKQETDTKKRDNRFSQTSDGRYFIPGTSIKGEIRNVLEILSFGKMTQVQDGRFGIRDLGDKTYRGNISGAHCGWLYRTVNSEGVKEYFIVDCEEPYRISQDEIDRKFKTNLGQDSKNFTLNGGNNEADEKRRSAYYKYKFIGKIKQSTEEVDFDSLKSVFLQTEESYGRKIVRYGNGGITGTLVFTGQSSKREFNRMQNKMTGKYYEFIFRNSSSKPLKIDQEVIDDFMTIHKENYDYKKLWERCLNEGKKIPVFFQKDGNRVSALGLAYMFRYPTANFIKGAIPASLQSTRHKDLAECMFGTESDSLGSLKGRVYFSPAFAEGQPRRLGLVNTTLSSPKPSFGPLYVKEGTWNSSKAIVKGRKRYPVREKVWNNEQGNANTGCSFIPLESGTVFKGVVRFHNLKIEEYGALLAAMTFNGHDECFHSIGEAKPLGYGKVKLVVENTKVVRNLDDLEVGSDESLNAFRKMMRLNASGWDNCPSLAQLYAMAKGVASGQAQNFVYMKMSKNRYENEFVIVKKRENNLNLPLFTEIVENKTKHIGPQDNKRVSMRDLNNRIEKFDEALENDDTGLDH